MFVLIVPHVQCKSSINSVIDHHHNVGARGSKHHLCTELKKISGMHNGAFITRDDGYWQYRADGSREYTVNTCRLKRFTAFEARKCLAGHHMLMIGDSVSRYQFIVLVYFLEHGRWPPRFGVSRTKECQHIDESGSPTCSPEDEPSVAAEDDWGLKFGHAAEKGWKQIHMYLGGAGFNGHLECDCCRGRDSIDNMYYRNIFRNGSFEIPPVKLTFLGSRGSSQGPMWGMRPSSCAEKGTCQLSSSDWDSKLQKLVGKKLDWQYYVESPDFTEALDKELIAPGVDIAIFNQGLWGHVPTNLKNVSAIFKGLFSLTQKHNGKCFWKGTTAGFNGAVSAVHQTPETFPTAERGVQDAAYSNGCGVFDLSRVTKDFTSFAWNGDIGRPKCCGDSEMMNVYWDAVHFQPWVYEEFNQILLNVLC
jgi:hypothetical protein